MPVDLLRDELIRVRRAEPAEDVSDLARWAAEALAAGRPVEPPRSTRAPQGPCAVCHEKPAGWVCLNCDRDVCAADAWYMLGLCRECLAPQDVERARQARAARRPALDVQWVGD